MPLSLQPMQPSPYPHPLRIHLTPMKLSFHGNTLTSLYASLNVLLKSIL